MLDGCRMSIPGPSNSPFSSSFSMGVKGKEGFNFLSTRFLKFFLIDLVRFQLEFFG